MSLTVWLIRHGQTSVNAGIWTAKPDECSLTALGKKQMEEVAQQIINPPNKIITSPLVRAQESAAYLLNQGSQGALEIWPIQEWVYLSPSRLYPLAAGERAEQIGAYWEKCDPFYCDGAETESFNSFLKRVEHFHIQLAPLNGFIVVVGHGQFFKAYQLGLMYGFHSTSTWMKRYRKEAVSNPITNGEIFKLFFK